MKLELKHLAPYLPYKLKVLVHGDFQMTMTYKRYIEPYDTESISVDGVLEDSYVKPILRPLSDLTKEIEHNGEKFVPIDNFIYKTSVEDFTEFPEQKHNLIHGLKYADIQLLLEHHFDVFGLIDKNLAIDINAL